MKRKSPSEEGLDLLQDILNKNIVLFKEAILAEIFTRTVSDNKCMRFCFKHVNAFAKMFLFIAKAIVQLIIGIAGFNEISFHPVDVFVPSIASWAWDG